LMNSNPENAEGAKEELGESSLAAKLI